jgi:hypothetical protein
MTTPATPVPAHSAIADLVWDPEDIKTATLAAAGRAVNTGRLVITGAGHHLLPLDMTIKANAVRAPLTLKQAAKAHRKAASAEEAARAGLREAQRILADAQKNLTAARQAKAEAADELLKASTR